MGLKALTVPPAAFFCFPALLKAIAIAWSWGFPAFISVLIFSETTFRDEPSFSGISTPLVPVLRDGGLHGNPLAVHLVALVGDLFLHLDPRSLGRGLLL